MSQSDPRLTPMYYLKLILGSAAFIVVGVGIFYLSISSGRIYPFVALIAGGMVILGALGLLLAIGVPILGFVGERFLFPHLARRADVIAERLYVADRERERGAEAWRLRSDIAYQMRRQERQAKGEHVPPLPERPLERPDAAQPSPVPRSSVAQLDGMATRQPPVPPVPEQPTNVPPRVTTPVPEQPPARQPGAPPQAQPSVAAPAPAEIPAGAGAPRAQWSPPSFRGWTLDALRARRQALDSAAMGFAFQNLDIPDEIVQEMNTITAEITTLEALGLRGTALDDAG